MIAASTGVMGLPAGSRKELPKPLSSRPATMSHGVLVAVRDAGMEAEGRANEVA